MLKQTSDIVSQENGDITQIVRFTCGPMRECAKCPCLLVMSDNDGGGILSQKKGFCAYYMAQLSADGDFPQKCKVAAITIEETL